MNFWITGRAGAGKTTLAHKLAEQLKLVVVDGDKVREASNNQDFTREGIKWNLQVITNVALEAIAKGHHVVIACVSPYKEMRKEFQSHIPDCVEVQLPGGTMLEGTVYEE